MGTSLEDLLTSGGPVKLLRNLQTGPYLYPVVAAAQAETP